MLSQYPLGKINYAKVEAPQDYLAGFYNRVIMDNITLLYYCIK